MWADRFDPECRHFRYWRRCKHEHCGAWFPTTDTSRLHCRNCGGDNEAGGQRRRRGSSSRFGRKPVILKPRTPDTVISFAWGPDGRTVWLETTAEGVYEIEDVEVARYAEENFDGLHRIQP
jgi:hypothetical protein